MSKSSSVVSGGDSVFHFPARPPFGRPTIIKVLSPPLSTPVKESQVDSPSSSFALLESAGPHNLQFQPSTPSPGYLREHEVHGNASGMRLLRQPTISEDFQPLSTGGFTSEGFAASQSASESVLFGKHLDDDDHDESSSQLDANQIIGIQALLKKKSWIEDKIKTLEGLPPVDPFAGLGDQSSISTVGEQTNELPDRIQLQLWLSELEAIEAEMESIDTGSLAQLKSFAKAKSKENLSPEDADLIELMLHTLVALEKLNHLLHLRSERLEMLRYRILWEEQRMAAWKERDVILADIENFVQKARWSTVVYTVFRSEERNEPPFTRTEEPTPPASPVFAQKKLRGVTTTPLSLSIAIPQTLLPSPNTDFSKENRFRLANSFTREATVYANRVLEYRTTRVRAAATTLDKLISLSREKVPDDILDEQDRLEVKSSVLDGLCRFGMNVVMQWIKCDSFYGDLKRMQASAQQLRDEVDKAMTFHPTSRLNESFSSRLAELSSRMGQVADPTSSRSFPRPAHPAYPDQESSNDFIMNILSMEVRFARELVDAASRAVDSYRSFFQSIKQVDKLRDKMVSISDRLASATSKLLKGATTREGDGSPVDITTESCLDPLRHMVYLASIPTLTWEVDDSDEAADTALSNCRTTLMDLQESGVQLESRLKMSVELAMSRLQQERIKAQKALEDVSTKTGFLREARELWTSINEDLAILDRIRRDLVSAAERQKWKPIKRDEFNTDKFSQKTDERPIPINAITPSDILARVEELSIHNISFVSPRESSLLPLLAPRLAEHIKTSSDALLGQISVMKEAIKLWEDMMRQKEVMDDVVQDACTLSRQLGEVKARMKKAELHVEQDEKGEKEEKDAQLSDGESAQLDYFAVREDIDRFIEELPTRIPFVTSATDFHSAKRLISPATSKFRADATQMFSFSLAQLDDEIRSDANFIAETLHTHSTLLAHQLESLKVASYINYAASFIFPNVLVPWVPFQSQLNSLSEWVFYARNLKSMTVLYLVSLKNTFLGDVRADILIQNQLMRIHFAGIEREIASVRRELEHERSERLRNVTEIRQELDGIVDQLRSHRANPGTEISTAKLEDIASSLAHITSFMESGRATENEDIHALDRLRHLALGGQRSVTFSTPPFHNRR